MLEEGLERCDIVDFEDVGMDHKPRNVGSL